MRTLVSALVLGLGVLLSQPAPPMFNPAASLDMSRFSISAPAHTRQGAWVGEAIGCGGGGFCED